MEPLPSQAGLFFKEEGTLFPSEESWKLVIYRDLKPLYISRDSLLRLSNKFQTMTSSHINFLNVQSIKSFLKINLEKIDNRLAELNMYLGKNSRVKRELLDGLSPILKWLIGTPDARDAKRYDECIDQLEKKELDLTQLMEKQLQITSSTINNFNETIFKISFDEQVINENIDRLNNFLNKTDKILFDLKISEDISTISIEILELVTQLEGEINDCLTSILFAKSNVIHPSIISMKKLYDELLLSNHIRTNKRLVETVTNNNIHAILDSSTLSAYVYSNRLVYILEFPLVRNEPLILYHLYSIPIQHLNSSFHTTILPEHIYLATNPNGQQYISTSSLENCNVYAPKKRVCNDLVVYESSVRPICEVQLLFSTSTSMPSSCTTTTFAAEINIFQPIGNNKWLFILSKEIQSVLQCNQEASRHKLQGSGIISIPENCKLHTGYSTLSAFHTSEENITYPIIVPDIRNDDCFNEYKHISAPKLIPISINEMPLDSLRQIKNHLNDYSEELKTIKEQTFIQRHKNSFSWIYFTIGIIMTFYLMIKCCNRCPNGFISGRQRQRQEGGLIQIFNNCFETSRRRNSTHLELGIPMGPICRQPMSKSTSCMTEDEEDDDTTPTQRSSAANAQSLF